MASTENITLCRTHPSRFYLLDILRGLASLSVVIWHYQHFYYLAPGKLSDEFDRSAQPFFELLTLFYTSGYQAVKLFFVLSGFIFFWLYQDKIRGRLISPGKFFVLRFSRLYPLHFVTLLLVALGQMVAQQLQGQFVVYPYNDVKHFILNLFFASDWGLQSGHSFNAPVWSVSIEVLLYALFFVYAQFGNKSYLSIVLMMLSGLAVVSLTNATHLGSGVFCFFAGGGVYHIYRLLVENSKFRLNPRTFTFLAISLTFFLAGMSQMLDSPLSTWLLYGGVFPSLVLTLALVQFQQQNLGHNLQIIGDITYSTYLLHFPLQLSIIVASTYASVTVDYNSPSAFLLFFGTLMLLSVLVYRYFELPALHYLRRTMLSAPNREP